MQKAFKAYTLKTIIWNIFQIIFLHAQQQPKCMHYYYTWNKSLFYSLQYLYKVVIYVKELTSIEALNSAYSIKWISSLFCLYWLAIYGSHDHFFIVIFGITSEIKYSLVSIPMSSDDKVMKGFLQGCKQKRKVSFVFEPSWQWLQYFTLVGQWCDHSNWNLMWVKYCLNFYSRLYKSYAMRVWFVFGQFSGECGFTI